MLWGDQGDKAEKTPPDTRRRKAGRPAWKVGRKTSRKRASGLASASHAVRVEMPETGGGAGEAVDKARCIRTCAPLPA